MKITGSAWCLVGILILMCLAPIPMSEAQDGASFNPKAKEYRAPAKSLAGAIDTPERISAMGLFLRGDMEKGLPALKQLAEGGDVASALLLGSIYRHRGKLPIEVDPAQALHFYQVASQQGSGEASERIAEMIEENEIPQPRQTPLFGGTWPSSRVGKSRDLQPTASIGSTALSRCIATPTHLHPKERCLLKSRRNVPTMTR